MLQGVNAATGSVDTGFIPNLSGSPNIIYSDEKEKFYWRQFYRS